MSQERRKNPRIDEKHQITVMLLPEERLPEDEILALSHETTDVSAGGLRFDSHKPIPMNSFMRVDVSLPSGEETISLSGVVRWVERDPAQERYMVGVEFFHLPGDPDMERWEAYISLRLRRAFEQD
jgi:c-di-GMP-binding flagellar brake protein YcgR